MLGYVLVTVIFAITILLFCWVLLKYLYQAIGRISDKELHKLRFKNKLAFKLALFWKRISEGRMYSQDILKDSAIVQREGESRETVSFQEFQRSKEKQRKDRDKRTRDKHTS